MLKAIRYLSDAQLEFFFLMNDEQKKMIADSFTRFPVYPKTSLIKYLD